MPAPSCSVLIVDDERFYREALREALLAASIPCDSAAEAIEALDRLADPDFGVVLLDVQLPGMSGVDVLRKLRDERPDLRVVVLSADTDQETVLEALRLGANDYLAKPLHDEEVVLSVQRARRAHALESELRELRSVLAKADSESSEEAANPDAEMLLAAVRGIAGAVADEIEPGPVLEAALGSLAAALGASCAAVYLVDPRSGDLVREGHWSAGESTDRERLARDRGLTGRALQGGSRCAMSEPSGDPHFDSEVDTPADGRPLSLACLPIRIRGTTVGVARVFGGAILGDDPWEAMAVALSAAVRNVLLYRSLLESIDDVARARRDSGR